MGSGNGNRKKSDTTTVRRPKAFSGLGLSATARGEYNADICIPSFDILLKEASFVKAGMKAYLEKEGDEYFINIAGLVKNPLPNRFSKMIAACLAMGVKYSGEIIETKINKYARFTRQL